MGHLGVSMSWKGTAIPLQLHQEWSWKRATGRTLPNYLDFGRCLWSPILWRDTWPKINIFIDLGHLHGTVWLDQSPERRKIGRLETRSQEAHLDGQVGRIQNVKILASQVNHLQWERHKTFKWTEWLGHLTSASICYVPPNTYAMDIWAGWLW